MLYYFLSKPEGVKDNKNIKVKVCKRKIPHFAYVIAYLNIQTLSLSYRFYDHGLSNNLEESGLMFLKEILLRKVVATVFSGYNMNYTQNLNFFFHIHISVLISIKHLSFICVWENKFHYYILLV